jgi:hypothetical protein
LKNHLEDKFSKTSFFIAHPYFIYGHPKDQGMSDQKAKSFYLVVLFLMPHKWNVLERANQKIYGRGMLVF